MLPYISSLWQWQKYYFKKNGELKLLIHITKISKNKSVFIDVSANVGNYSIELIKAGITGKLILVDPLNKIRQKTQSHYTLYYTLF